MRLFYFFLSNFCGNCAYFKPARNLYLSTCNRFNGEYTDLCRKDESMCGFQGSFYIPKEFNTVPEVKSISCINCKHYESSYQRCKAFFKINDVTGGKTLESSVLCRQDQKKCGKYARFFKPYSYPD